MRWLGLNQTNIYIINKKFVEKVAQLYTKNSQIRSESPNLSNWIIYLDFYPFQSFEEKLKQIGPKIQMDSNNISFVVLKNQIIFYCFYYKTALYNTFSLSVGVKLG